MIFLAFIGDLFFTGETFICAAAFELRTSRFKFDILVLKLFIEHHDLLETCLWPSQGIKLLDKVLVDRLLELVYVLNQIAEPVAVRGQITTFLQIFDWDWFSVGENVRHFTLVLQNIIQELIVVRLLLKWSIIFITAKGVHHRVICGLFILF